MRIIVGSQSQVKLDAVYAALETLGIEAEVIGVKAKSNVAEQPIDGETLRGARNRAQHARDLAPDGDLYIAVESGVFGEGERYVDKAVVLSIAKDGTETTAMSEGVEFPKASVDKARERGFDTTTVGQVMAEDGIVAKHDDPHMSLVGQSRASVLQKTVTELLSKQLKWSKFSAVNMDARFHSSTGGNL